MKSFSFIGIGDEGEVVSITLNRPPLNIMNISMMEEINGALEALLGHPRAKVLLIRGEGKAFSAGVDIADHTPEKAAGMMKEFSRMFELLNRFTIPVIAVVQGAALGGGCELAIFCDMIVASERAVFGQPEMKVGVYPPIAVAILPRLIGRNRTLEWLLNGESIGADEAAKIGLVNRVFPAEGFDEQVNTFVSKFSSQSKAILGLTKKAVDRSLDRPAMDAIAGAERIYMDEVMKTEDAGEGLKAFLEKRKPVWKNR